MQTDSKSRTSFFDDDDLSINFHFKKVEKPLPKNLEVVPSIRENLAKHIVGASSPPVQGSFALHNKKLVYYKTSNTKQADSYLELANSRLNVAILNGTNNQYGFSLTKNGITYEFYSSEKQIIDDWMTLLKTVCILTTFHEEYKALKMIGRGSFAKVYLVESKANGKSFAVKAFTKESVIISNKNSAKPSMINEIDLMRSLNHDHIIKLYEVFETEKSIYLVIELIQGKSLQDVLKKPLFKEEYSENKIMKMIFSILDALAYLASKGIMHRDLKPDNILVDKDDKIKIADFGLATYIDLPEYIFKKCGTPGYIAPEVFKYDQKLPETFYDHRCDAFSAGGIFYYMLFGRPFFDGSNASEILRMNRKFSYDADAINNIRHEMKDPKGKINKEGLNLLMQLVDFDQRKRMSTIASLSHNYFIPMYNESFHSLDVASGGANHNKRNSISVSIDQVMNHHFSRTNSIDTHGGNNQRGDRFAEKDSLYLDMGKPDLNGRINTLANGSHNNSILLQRNDSHNSFGSREGSAFRKQSNPNTPEAKSQRKSFRSNVGNQSFLKAAIFRNMQKHNEESKEEIEGIHAGRGSALTPTEQNHHGNASPGFHSYGANSPSNGGHSRESSSSSVDSTNDICHEDAQVHSNVEYMKAASPMMKPSRHAHSPTKERRNYFK